MPIDLKPSLRPELEPLPYRMQDLPVDERGYIVPWFVAWHDGHWDFRAMDARKWPRAVREKLCWVCGKQLGVHLAFVIGPMCGITRTTSEPACHLECARWSARNCPFLSRPHMHRRPDETGEMQPAAGIMIERNPGVTLIWVTRSFEVWNDGKGKPLITVGDPESIEFYCEGRTATRAEIDHSITTGLPLLEEAAHQDKNPMEAMTELMRQRARFERLLPA